ncbi:hypothetical protein [Spiroplasma endosymbiont of Villa modesta]|uniref:hypothetical protein n=1 Tax=Spiroplasma endosymbiont of Villa modesta TaxID=3066293 RepID=UPI00313D9106
MNKQKLFSYKDQEIINEYNKKRNQEITEEHLNNIEKLREDFKKEVINEYKEKLREDLDERITWLTNEISNVKHFKQIEFYIWEKICLKNIIIKIEQGIFD